MEFSYIIEYTSNKNAYVKISEEGKVVFRIPQWLKNDSWLFQKLYEKAELLRKKHESRPKIEKRNEEGVLLFGEFVPWKEVIQKPWKTYSDKQIEKLLKEILIEYVTEYVKIFSTKIGEKYQSITIKKSKTKRWSCSYDQKLMFNLSLIFLPGEYIQYVVAHEVAHLQFKNHKTDFWKLVEHLFPRYKMVRKKLKNLIIL